MSETPGPRHIPTRTLKLPIKYRFIANPCLVVAKCSTPFHGSFVSFRSQDFASPELAPLFMFWLFWCPFVFHQSKKDNFFAGAPFSSLVLMPKCLLRLGHSPARPALAIAEALAIAFGCYLVSRERQGKPVFAASPNAAEPRLRPGFGGFQRARRLLTGKNGGSPKITGRARVCILEFVYPKSLGGRFKWPNKKWTFCCNSAQEAKQPGQRNNLAAEKGRSTVFFLKPAQELGFLNFPFLGEPPKVAASMETAPKSTFERELFQYSLQKGKS